DHGAMSFYGCITTISESPRQEGLIYVGTDDGLIQVTEDGGKNWRKIDKLPGIPEFAFVNEVKASEHDAGTVFAVFDNHKRGDFKPYIMKSSDRGRTWSSITGDIPDRHITWCIVQDHVKPNLLFTGTEFGIFFTPDGGLHWHKLTGGLPTISFRDLEIQKRENDLVGASFGRGIYILDDYSPLREVMPELWTREAMLFPVKKALSYIPRTPLGSRDKADQGHAFFTAPNPPFGAVFTYYLKESMLSGKEKRLDMEKKLDTEGNPIPFPGWHELYREEWEDKPAVILTIKDMDGQVVRRLNGPVTSGIHRVTWDLRYPAVNPTRITQENLLPWERHPIGPMVVPGTFRVELAKRIDGVLSPFGEPQIFTVESLGLSGLTGADKAAIMAFQAKAGRLQRVMMGADKILEEVIDCLRFIKKALMDTPNVDIRLYAEAVAIEKRAREISIELNGDEMLRERGEPVSPSLIRRISAPLNTTEPITATVKRNYEIAAAEYSILEKKLRQLVDVDLKKLEQDMDAAGAPWTPGRDIPKWND
ncbi:MAG: glycosyl hydrolase, partial [Acidobacteria bacterium]|nr:glycosyl hydrolase [Acidobacteriota bacterium]